MNIIKFRTLALLIVVFAASALCRAQAQTTPAPSDNYVSNSGFKNRVFEVHNRMPEELVPVIRLLTSGFKGAQISASNEFHTITVRDFPENIASIDEAIKRLDKPETARPDIELRMHVLMASNREGASGQYPADLKNVIAELQPTLNYKEYSLLTSIVQRTRESQGERPGYVQGRGAAMIEWRNPNVPSGFDKKMSNYEFSANSVALSNSPTGMVEVRLGGFNFSLSIPGSEAKIHSDLSIREGEKVVVGTAGFSDNALILVMTARVIK